MTACLTLTIAVNDLFQVSRPFVIVDMSDSFRNWQHWCCRCVCHSTDWSVKLINHTSDIGYLRRRRQWLRILIALNCKGRCFRHGHGEPSSSVFCWSHCVTGNVYNMRVILQRLCRCHRILAVVMVVLLDVLFQNTSIVQIYRDLINISLSTRARRIWTVYDD